MENKTNEERLKCVEKLLYEVETNTLLYFNTANQRIYDCIVDAKSTIIDIIKEQQEEIDRLRQGKRDG